MDAVEAKKLKGADSRSSPTSAFVILLFISGSPAPVNEAKYFRCSQFWGNMPTSATRKSCLLISAEQSTMRALKETRCKGLNDNPIQ